jgi:hypothetical protein
MLSPRLNDCIDCATIPVLLTDIDQKIAALAQDEYNNIVFSLNHLIPGEVVGDLLHYKQILTYKQCNLNYCPDYTVAMIGSRVKVLIHK